MSIEALNWCIKQKCDTPTTKLVLFILSNYSDEKNSCYPSEKKLAKLVGVSDRQIRRCLNWLEKNRYIKIEPRAGTSNRYYVSMDISVQTGRTSVSEGGRKPMSYNTKEDTKEDTRDELYSDHFKIFWKEYPRKIGKYSAAQSYKKATKKNSHKMILERVITFAKSNAMTEERFIPHAQTWLNQKRFLDVPSEKKKNTMNNLAG